MLATCTDASGRVMKPAWMMPCAMSWANSFVEVCLMISRVWPRTSTRLPLATALLMISAAMTVLPAPVGATRRTLGNTGRQFLPALIDRVELVGAQLGHGTSSSVQEPSHHHISALANRRSSSTSASDVSEDAGHIGRLAFARLVSRVDGINEFELPGRNLIGELKGAQRQDFKLLRYAGFSGGLAHAISWVASCSTRAIFTRHAP